MPTPVIIGVADIKNRTDDAKEPAQLILEAIHDALHDAGNHSQLVSSIDSLAAVRTWTWAYENLPVLLAEKLGARPSHTQYPDYHGGNQPAKLLDEAALRVANGEARVAVVTGGEALATCEYSPVGPMAPWPQDVQADTDSTSEHLHERADIPGLDSSLPVRRAGLLSNDPWPAKEHRWSTCHWSADSHLSSL